MNINHIFSLFKQQENGNSPDIIKLYKQHPSFWIKMFNKIINNHDALNIKVLMLFQKADNSLDISDVNKAGDYIVYNRAWDFISKINVKDCFHQEILFDNKNEELISQLNETMKYFQTQEEFEKCSHLKQIIDFINLIS